MKRLMAMIAALLAICAVPARAEDVVVFAAASLTNAIDDIGARFTAQTGNRIVASYAASSTLAKQIEQGAPAQLFASADLKWAEYLADKKLIDAASRIDLLGNALVLVAPADGGTAKLEIGPATDFAALAGAGRIATGDPDSVPVGIYFRQAMERSGQWDRVAPRLARTDSVRSALALVERGEVPFGVVYATDAAVSPKVSVVGVFPAAMHDPILYPFALVTGNESKAARAFLAYLAGAEARAVFVKYGFTVRGAR